MGWITVERLGQGSFGCVDLVRDSEAPSTNPDMLFAVKSCFFSKSASLKKEFGILSRCYDCPYIVRCFGEDLSFDEYDNLIYHLKLEYAPGGTLKDLITKNGGSLSEEEVKRYTRMIVQALCYLHQFSVIHCDLKPANILVFPDKDGMFKVKIADLGLAKWSSDPYSMLHSRYEFRGTPLYMSPESVGNGDIRTALDIWSLGCVVIEMITGQPPWDKTINLMEELCLGSRAPKIPENLSKEGKDFLDKCLCSDPDKRWTAEMLLKHPFLGDHEEDNNVNDKGLEELSGRIKSALCIDEVVQKISSSPSTLLPSSGIIQEESTPQYGLPQDLNITQEDYYKYIELEEFSYLQPFGILGKMQ